MDNPDCPPSEPISELNALRQRLAELETAHGRARIAENALSMSEKRFRTLVDTIPHGIEECDTQGQITFANAALHRINGYPLGEIVGKYIWDLLDSEQAKEELREYLCYLVEKQPAPTTYTAVNRHKDGTPYDVEVDWDYRYNEDGTLAGFIAVVTDVTQRKQAEDALRRGRDLLEQRVNERTRELAQANKELTRQIAEREAAEISARRSQEIYHGIFESVADGLLLVDRDGRITDANRAACETYGYTADELIGRQVVELICPEHRHLFAQVAEQIHSGDTANLEAANLHKDGSIIFIELRATIFEFENTKKALCVVRDLTARKKAEQALEREQGHLRRLLEMLEHDRQLVAYEIHDGFVQSLVGARMLLDMPYDPLPPNGCERFEKAVALLNQGIEEARRLISGQRPLILDESGLMAAIEHLVCERKIGNGQEIEYQDLVSFDRLAPPLETAVFRIVQEGLNNAERHSQSPKVRLRVTQEDERLRVEIRDWGVGFDPDHVGRNCFGLEGLRERARIFGGTAQIDTAPGVGTTVTVEFPIVGKLPQDGI